MYANKDNMIIIAIHTSGQVPIAVEETVFELICWYFIDWHRLEYCLYAVKAFSCILC